MAVMRKILVADDNRDIGRIVGVAARALGMTCIETSDANGFLEALSPDVTLILLDLVMPGMDGIELLRHVGQLQCEADVVLMSGVGTRIIETAEQFAQNLGFSIVGRLEKPFRIAELQEILKRHLEQKTQRQPLRRPAVSIRDAELRNAVKRNEFVIHYQPQIEISTENVVGVEALVRWQHPEYGLVYPDSFIDRLEALGLIDRLGQIVAERSLSEVGQFSDNNQAPIELSLNISALSLQDLSLPDTLAGLAVRYGVPMESITLEITESSVLGELSLTLDVLCRLRLNRTKLAIDDFGRGYSMMQQLRNIPATELKIDMSFIQKMLTDNRDRVIVLKTIEMGHELRMRVVAEGIETSEQLEYLRSQGCDIGQGYFFSRPLPARETVDSLGDYRSRQLVN